MKKILILFCTAVLINQSCKKSEPKVVSKVVTVSYPTINVKGSKFQTLSVGTNWVDSGATLTDDVTGVVSTIYADTPIVVDKTTPGLYCVTYSAKNANGYQSTSARYIAVTNYPDVASLEGTYKRLSNSRIINLTRKSRALYASSDMGGAGISDVGYIAILDTNKADFGKQYSESIGAWVYADMKTFHLRTADTSYSYVLHAPGYGFSTRVFVKQ